MLQNILWFEKRKELTKKENILWYLSVMGHLKNSPVSEIYSQVWWEGSDWGLSFVLFFFSFSKSSY